jgi:DNA-binding XRE family transcriptional regulator
LDIAERIKLVRGKTPQDEFARLIEVHKSSLGRYERGESTPDMDFAAKVCSVFGIKAEWILLGIGPMRAGESPPAAALEPETAALAARVAALESQNSKLEAENRCQREVLEAHKETLSLYRELRGNMGPTMADAPASAPNARMIDPLSEYDFNVF